MHLPAPYCIYINSSAYLVYSSASQRGNMDKQYNCRFYTLTPFRRAEALLSIIILSLFVSVLNFMTESNIIHYSIGLNFSSIYSLI